MKLTLSVISFLIFVFFSVFFTFYELPPGESLAPPNLQYPLGTYINGENMINVNARANVDTLIFGSIVGSLEILLALTYGTVAGAYGGKVRTIMVRFLDAINEIPRIPFLLSLALLYGTPTGKYLIGNFFIIALTVALTGWQYYARQIAEVVYNNYSYGIVSFALKNSWRDSLRFFIPMMLDGISTYTAMGVIGGVGDPNFPTLTTLLTTSSKFIEYYWLFLTPAIFRGILLIILYNMVK